MKCGKPSHITTSIRNLDLPMICFVWIFEELSPLNLFQLSEIRPRVFEENGSDDPCSNLDHMPFLRDQS